MSRRAVGFVCCSVPKTATLASFGLARRKKGRRVPNIGQLAALARFRLTRRPNSFQTLDGFGSVVLLARLAIRGQSPLLIPSRYGMRRNERPRVTSTARAMLASWCPCCWSADGVCRATGDVSVGKRRRAAHSDIVDSRERRMRKLRDSRARERESCRAECG